MLAANGESVAGRVTERAKGMGTIELIVSNPNVVLPTHAVIQQFSGGEQLLHGSTCDRGLHTNTYSNQINVLSSTTTDYTTLVVAVVVLFPVFPPPEWTFMCLVNWSPLPKHLPQPGSGQTYGRAPVCVRS